MLRLSERFTVTGGFCLLLLLFLLESDLLLVFAILSAAMLHEVGHALAIHACGAGICALRITAFGAQMQLSNRGRLSYPREIAVHLAGPMINLLCAFLLAQLARVWEPGYLFAGTQLVLGLFNLLPIVPLDGGKALYLALAYLSSPRLAERVTTVAGGLLLAAFSAAVGGVIWQSGGNLQLLLAILGLFLAFLRAIKGGSYL